MNSEKKVNIRGTIRVAKNKVYLEPWRLQENRAHLAAQLFHLNRTPVPQR
jgi:hypothetical protein